MTGHTCNPSAWETETGTNTYLFDGIFLNCVVSSTSYAPQKMNESERRWGAQGWGQAVLNVYWLTDQLLAGVLRERTICCKEREAVSGLCGLYGMTAFKMMFVCWQKLTLKSRVTSYLSPTYQDHSCVP